MKPLAACALYVVGGSTAIILALHHPLLAASEPAESNWSAVPGQVAMVNPLTGLGPQQSLFAVSMRAETNVPVSVRHAERQGLLFIPHETTRTTRAAHASRTPAPEPLKPGVYEAKPYSGIVVVPGPHPDDKCLFWPGATVDKMPGRAPDLRLNPRTPFAPAPMPGEKQPKE